LVNQSPEPFEVRCQSFMNIVRKNFHSHSDKGGWGAKIIAQKLPSSRVLFISYALRAF
jgi:hypothetical protein